MRRKIIAGNWKMNGDAAFVQNYLKEFSQLLAEKQVFEAQNVQIVIASPAVYLRDMSSLTAASKIQISAQNISEFDKGAYTGEVAANMLSDFGCEFCLVGHSERRLLFGETNTVVVEKVKRLLSVNVQPVLCVGETLEQRDSGCAKAVVAEQLMAVIDAFDVNQLAHIVVAYEPVWAIGTGKTASPDQAQEMHKVIRQNIAKKSDELAAAMRILYGGSMNASNAKALLAQEDIDGGLVGGASLKAKEFIHICEMAA